MNRKLILAVAAFLVLGMAAAWNGRRMRDALAQVRTQVASANLQRMEMGKLNAGLSSPTGRPRMEDSVLALAERVAPWMASSPPGMAGAAVGQGALRNTIWHPTSWGAEPGLDVFENAQTMASGHFDLALAMVFALPLVILFAPRQDTVMLAMGPVVSLVGILMSGAPLASVDTWLRTAAWLVLTGLYGFFWLMVRERQSVYWMTGVTYLVLVVLVPGLAVMLGELMVPAPSRIQLAERKQAYLQPVMEKSSRALAPFYESHPEYVEGGLTAADYDRVRLGADAERHAVVAPLLSEVEAKAEWHRQVVEGLGKLSPAAILHMALLETAGTGISRSQAFEASAREFGRIWAAAIKRGLEKGHPLRPADLDQLPVFIYQEQPLGSWLMPVGIGLLSLLAWLGALRVMGKKT